MTTSPNAPELKENTPLLDPYFPVNLFFNRGSRGPGPILFLHWHEHLEIIRMVSGEATFTVGGQSLDARPGDLLFVGSGELHTGHTQGCGSEVEYIAIVLHPSLLAGSGADPLHAATIAPYANGDQAMPAIVRPGDPPYEALSQPIAAATAEFRERAAGYEMSMKLHFQQLFTQLARHYPGADGEWGRSREASLRLTERFKPLLEHLELHYAEKITVEDGAAMVNLSPYHFCKSFKKATGRTFVEFLQLIRVSEAEKRLKHTTLPITEIASQVGFGNINYFDKVFKKIKHHPPSQLRK